jgi:hypothetical protein
MIETTETCEPFDRPSEDCSTVGRDDRYEIDRQSRETVRVG